MDRPVEVRVYFILPREPGENAQAYKKTFNLNYTQTAELADYLDGLAAEPVSDVFSTFSNEDIEA